jgi:hypothetical protein
VVRYITDPRDEKWFRLGDITLCNLCNRAIQLRREKISGVGWCDIWKHFQPHPVGHHSAEPKLSLWEGAELRDATTRLT